MPLFFNTAPLAYVGGAARVMLSGYTGCVGTASRLTIAHIEGGALMGAPVTLTGDPVAGSRELSGWHLRGRARDALGVWLEGSSCSGTDGPGPLVLAWIPREL